MKLQNDFDLVQWSISEILPVNPKVVRPLKDPMTRFVSSTFRQMEVKKQIQVEFLSPKDFHIV